jgi:hypothetical protein
MTIILIQPDYLRQPFYIEYSMTIILSDGDVVFQPRKVQLSGLRESLPARLCLSVCPGLFLGGQYLDIYKIYRESFSG